MDGTAREGLHPFSIITSSCISDPLFFIFFKKDQKILYHSSTFFFWNSQWKKPKTDFINEPMMNLQIL